METGNNIILIVEDNPGDFFLIKEFLNRTNLPKYEIIHAESVEDTIRLLNENSFELILVDLFLPDSDGVETFDKILPLAGYSPVIVLTGLVNQQVTLEILKKGAQDYLVKGEYDEKLLEKTIRYAIERKANQVYQKKSEENTRKHLEKLVQERTQELQEALKKEKQLVEMKNQFVAIASHEFRTPLATINFATNFLYNYLDRIDKEEILSKLRKIERQVLHMTALLDDVIMAGRTDLNKIPVIKSRIKIKSIIDKIVEEVQHTTKNTHTIALQYNVSVTEIETDEKLLRNILINLLTNAIKFSPNFSRVDFIVMQENDMLNIEVSDKGIGIAEDDKPRLFEAFHRGKNATTISGTGLGLSIVKKAVELLNGTIELISEVNQGTTVKITLPIET